MARDPFFPEDEERTPIEAARQTGGDRINSVGEAAGAFLADELLEADAPATAAPRRSCARRRFGLAGGAVRRGRAAAQLPRAARSSRRGIAESRRRTRCSIWGGFTPTRRRYDLAAATMHARAVALRERVRRSGGRFPGRRVVPPRLVGSGGRAGHGRRSRRCGERCVSPTRRPSRLLRSLGEICTNLALLLADAGARTLREDEEDEDDEQESLLRLRTGESGGPVRPGCRSTTAAALNNLANVYARRGDFERAVALAPAGVARAGSAAAGGAPGRGREPREPRPGADGRRPAGRGRAAPGAGAGDRAAVRRAGSGSMGQPAGAARGTASRPARITRLRCVCWRRRWRRQERRFGLEDLEVAGTLNNLAGVYAGLGMFEQAEGAARGAWRSAAGRWAGGPVRRAVAAEPGVHRIAAGQARRSRRTVPRSARPGRPPRRARTPRRRRRPGTTRPASSTAGAIRAPVAGRGASRRAAAVQQQAAESDLFAPDVAGVMQSRVRGVGGTGIPPVVGQTFLSVSSCLIMCGLGRGRNAPPLARTSQAGMSMPPNAELIPALSRQLD